MRSKTPLALMEQAIMVLVFALAAALCLRVFVWSNETSKSVEARDCAAVEVQSAAEVIKNEGRSGLPTAQVLAAAAGKLGAVNGASGFELPFDSDWEPLSGGDAAYILTASAADSAVPGLGKALVSAIDTKTGDTIFELTVAWQTEVGE